MRLLGESTSLQDHEIGIPGSFSTLGGSATALFGSSFLYFMWTFFFKRNIYTFIITGQKENLYKRYWHGQETYTRLPDKSMTALSILSSLSYHYYLHHYKKGRTTGASRNSWAWNRYYFWCFFVAYPLLEYWKEEEREGGKGG